MLDQHQQRQLVKKEVSPKVNTNRSLQKQKLEKDQPDLVSPVPFTAEVNSESQDQVSNAVESKKCAQQ